MTNSISVALEANATMPLIFAKADLLLRILFQIKKVVMINGTSRIGKSTLMNHVFNADMVGIQSQNKANQIIYQLVIKSSDYAEAGDRSQSVTLIPNIQIKDDTLYIDFAGYRDQRGYREVMAVSFILKLAFQRIQDCKFILVTSDGQINGLPELAQNLIGFTSMFDFQTMPQQTKIKIYQSTVITIVRSSPGADKSGYIKTLKRYISELSELSKPSLKTIKSALDKKNVIDFMTYFVQNEQKSQNQRKNQIYMFQQAKLLEKSPKCTLETEILSKIPFFHYEEQNKLFTEKFNKSLSILPYTYDYNRLQQEEKKALQAQIQERIDSFKIIAQILAAFFTKAIQSEHIYSENLQFKDEFVAIQKFTKQFRPIYKDFNIALQTKLMNDFDPDKSDRKLKNGIDRVQNTFKLYQLFGTFTEYQNKKDKDGDKYFKQFMSSFSNHYSKILTLFRDTFCKNYQQEVLIQQLLHVGLRGISQFTTIYQINKLSKNAVCRNLTDSFNGIMITKSFKQIQTQFVQYIIKNADSLKDTEYQAQLNKYIQYLQSFKNKANKISQQDEFKQIQSIFLNEKIRFCNTPQQKLFTLFTNLSNYIEITKRKMRDYDSQQSDNQSYNFKQTNQKFCYLLLNIGLCLIRLKRADTLEKDKFVQGRDTKYFKNLKFPTTIKEKLTYEGLNLAKDIFSYVGSQDKVLETFDHIIKNFAPRNYEKRLEFLIGKAQYCFYLNRFEQGTIILQEAKTLCYEHNITKGSFIKCKQSSSKKVIEPLTGAEYIQQRLIQLLNSQSDYKEKYLVELKKVKKIDPQNDYDLQRIITDLQDNFIQPYKEYLKLQKNN